MTDKFSNISKEHKPAGISKPKTVAPAPFSFPQEAAQAVSNANSAVVGLPFETYVWFIRNGRPAAKNVGGVDYTGGFGCSTIPEKGWQITDVLGEVHDLSDIFEPITVTNLNSQGTPYDTVDLPELVVTPVVYRKRFFEGRSHTQVLCLQRLPSAEEIVVWTMLSARGYQSSILLDELGTVATGTANARRELGNPPVNFFWHRVGMPGIPEFRPVGKGSTSIITPVKAALISDDLREAYIGNDLANIIGEAVTLDEVVAWKDAWKEDKSTPFSSNDNKFDNSRENNKFDDVPF